MRSWTRSLYPFALSSAPCSGVVLAAALLIVPSPGISQTSQGDRRSSVLVLRDPTPREIDLDKILGQPSQPEAPKVAHQIAEMNHQRYQLITRASSQVQTLSSLLQRALAGAPPKTSLASEVQVAGVIELLAANVHSALSPRREVPPFPKADETRAAEASADQVDRSQLNAEAERLAAVAADLEREVSRSSAGTLSVKVLERSAEVTELARSLKGRMQRP